MGSNNSKDKVNTEETVFTPLARGVKIEQPKISRYIRCRSYQINLKNDYFSEIKVTKNKN